MKQLFFIFLLFVLQLPVLAADTQNLQQQLFLNNNTLSLGGYTREPIEEDEQELQISLADKKSDKSRGKAFLYSLLIPGLGENYLGKTTRAQIFFGTEVSLWLGYSGFIMYRDWRKEDYKTYAASFAGVDLSGKEDSYFVNMGNYNSIYDYNAAKLRQRNLLEYYQDVEKYYWQWDTAAHRNHFDQLRISADKADNRATFIIGAIFANHLISAIDAIWAFRSYQHSQQTSLEWDVQFGDGLIQPNVNVGVAAHF